MANRSTDLAPTALEAEYAAGRPRSEALYRRALVSLPSGVSHDGRVFTPFPFYVKSADGPRKWDVDGNSYLDGWCGHGSLVLGHNYPAVVNAILDQARLGLHYGACHELELRWAELIREIVPGAERVRFTVTGTETTALAVRVARAHTQRTAIIKCQGHFHGISDGLSPAVKVPFSAPFSAGIPRQALETTLVARHNDLDGIRQLVDQADVAAVILEPGGAHTAVAPPSRAFLHQLRALTKEREIVLIFDEVVTGFRLAPGGAQEYYGVTADLVCFGKAVAGGLPGAALAGRAEIMDRIAFTGNPEHDRQYRVADQGTHSGAPIVAAAGVAALEILRTGAVQRRLNELGARLRAQLNEVLRCRQVPGCVYGEGSVFRIFLGGDADSLGITNSSYDHELLDRGMGPLGAQLHLAMLVNGVDYSRGLSLGWLNAAMANSDVDSITEAFDRSIARLTTAGLIGREQRITSDP